MGRNQNLSDDERRLAQLLATPLSFIQIGALLGISRAEVSALAIALYRKLDIAEANGVRSGHSAPAKARS